MKRSFSLIVSALVTAFSVNADDFIAAEYIESRNSSVPEKTANHSRLEGWTLLSYFVGLDGEPENVVIIDSSDESKFGGEAVFTLKNWRYKPASYKGEAVVSAEMALMRTDKSFNWSANDGISLGFKRHYNDADNFMLKGEMEKAKASLDELREDHAKNLTEQALSAWLHSIYYFRLQDWPAYGSEVQTAHYLNEFLPSEMKLKNIQNRLKWHMFKREFTDAIYILDELKARSNGALSESDYQSMLEEIKKHLRENPANQIDITLANGRAWKHKLPRSTISLNVQAGEINFAELRCDNGHQRFTEFPIQGFDIPEDYLKCSFFVKGNDNSYFTFEEKGDTRPF